MLDLSRRRFLQATSAVLAGGTAPLLWGDDNLPTFAPVPTFNPEVVLLTWQRDPTSTMTIQWIGKEEEGRDRPIWFSRQGSMEWKQSLGAVRPYPLTEQKIFRTELTGLEPDTEYLFRIGLDSAERRFRTMPAKATNTVQFVSGGDSGAGSHAEQTNRLAAAQSPAFVVMGGDLAYENGRNADTFYKFLKSYSQQLIDDQQRTIPMLACIGNHEVDGGYGKPRDAAPFFYAFFDGLFSDTGFAALDFGDYMSLVFLDSNHTTPVAGEQTDWLENTLKEREDCPTVFAFTHVPCYPSYRPYVGKDGDEDSGTGADGRKHWAPLFERYNVDAVFEHHDHTFKRTHPLLDGRIDNRGIIYLGDGSWGKLRRPKTSEERPYLAKTDENYHLSVHRIEGKDRFHVALSDTGKIVDVCATKKRNRGLAIGPVSK
jgi:hypothetical protein